MPRRDGYAKAFALTVSLFALWGLGHRLYDTLLPQFVQVFALRGVSLVLTQSVYSIVYVVGAIPAALYARRLGYKAGIIFGLGCLIVGAFLLYPAAQTHVLSYLVVAVVMISGGWIFLEVSANPLMAGLGPDETSVRRLNTAQAFYPLGALIGVYVGRGMLDAKLALPSARDAYSIAHPYILIGAGVLLLVFLVEEARFPAIATERSAGGVGAEIRILLARPMYRFAVAAQFFGTLALAGSWALAGEYRSVGGMPLDGGIYVWSLAAFAAGRIAGTALMYRFEPDRVLAAFALGGLVSASAGMIVGGPGALVLSSFFVSIAWPTILGIAIRGQGSRAKLGTAFICMSGALGGVGYEVIATALSAERIALSIVAGSFAVVVIYAFAVTRTVKAAADAAALGLSRSI